MTPEQQATMQEIQAVLERNAGAMSAMVAPNQVIEQLAVIAVWQDLDTGASVLTINSEMTRLSNLVGLLVMAQQQVMAQAMQGPRGEYG